MATNPAPAAPAPGGPRRTTPPVPPKPKGPTELVVTRHHLGNNAWELSGEVLSENNPVQNLDVSIHVGADREVLHTGTHGQFSYDTETDKPVNARVRATSRLNLSIPLPVMVHPEPVVVPGAAPAAAGAPLTLRQKWEKINNRVFAVATILLLWLALRTITDFGSVFFTNPDSDSPEMQTETISNSQSEAEKRAEEIRNKYNRKSSATSTAPTTAKVTPQIKDEVTEKISFYYRPMFWKVIPLGVVGTILILAGLGIFFATFRFKTAIAVGLIILGIDQWIWTGPSASTDIFGELLRMLFVLVGHHQDNSWFRLWFLLFYGIVIWIPLIFLCFYDEALGLAHKKHAKDDGADHTYSAEIVEEEGKQVVAFFIDGLRQNATASAGAAEGQMTFGRLFGRIATIDFIWDIVKHFVPRAFHELLGIFRKGV